MLTFWRQTCMKVVSCSLKLEREAPWSWRQGQMITTSVGFCMIKCIAFTQYFVKEWLFFQFPWNLVWIAIAHILIVVSYRFNHIRLNILSVWRATQYVLSDHSIRPAEQLCTATRLSSEKSVCAVITSLAMSTQSRHAHSISEGQ